MANNSLLLMLGASSAVLVTALAGGGAAMAQTAASDKASSDSQADQAVVDEIVVTGSRLARTGYDAPTPVNVIGEARREALAINSVGDALNQIPSFRPISSPATSNFRVSSAISARTLDLRGLGATRTLTLVDGRRFVTTTDNGTIDVNAIPTIMVQRAEVVTGGASAAYGADAVAGVVNLILDTKFTGTKAEVSTGVTRHNDGKSYYAAAAHGANFAGGRGHVVAGFEYLKETGVGQCETRDWCSKYTNFVANPGYNTATRTSTNGLPATLVLDHVMFVYNENGILTGAQKPNGTGGTINLGQQILNVGATSLPAALRGKQFDPNGNLVPYEFGDLLSGLFQVKPNGDPTQPFLIGQAPAPLVVPDKHFSGMIHADYDLTDKVSMSTEFMYAHVVGGPTQSTVPLDGPATLDINNPYISAATRATVLAADPAITKLLVNHGAWSLGASTIGVSTNDLYRGAIGLKGDFGGGWKWDAGYTYGRVEGDVVDERLRLKEWNNAVDAVVAPAGLPGIAAGAIICRTTLTNPTNGCIPINLFAPTVSAAADARYNVTATQTRTYVNQSAAVNLRGAPFSTWAGEVNIAVGAEWRRDTAEGAADANTLANNYISPATSALPFTKTSVTEGYLEAGVPLLKDSPVGKSLDVDGAVRFTHYNPFGDATTWKVGTVYRPTDDVTFRVTRSRDIRAPSALESTPNATRTQLPQPDPFVGGTTLQFTVTGGNPALELEHADTFTAGVVLKPSFIPRFNLSVDYYDIKVDGAIDSLNSTAIANACKQQKLLCNLIDFNSNGSINTVYTTYQNLSQLHAEGYELVVDYRLPAFGGNFDFQGNGNYVVDLSTIGATGLVSQFDGVTGNAGTVQNIQGVPRWRADGVVTYTRTNWSLTAHGRYIPKSILDPTKIGPEQRGYDINNPNSVNINHVSARFYLDLSFRIKIPEASGESRFEVFGGINNVLDTEEPKQLRLFGNGLYYDPFGRAFKIGARMRL
ncbi:TonB-dependent receptor domain-containing protein [Caulobacter sp.]|uniref:TonB-dependent receptor domain-containing protein n=1 Tax=Caulobacter sp. TaxID=78 RepID=UPI002B460FD4|nr:TonB-dependent receptor [Caulobacter sp.]HJV40899.1 TonB-dependent receptor [Caulobacter sp.]